MKKNMRMNKKGFTLVELLAVIVILALIMAIAVVSMSGIMTSARNSTFKETGVQIINGVQQQLTLANELLPSNTKFASGVQYFVEKKMLEKGGDSAPLGGTYQFISSPDTSIYTQIGVAGLWRYDGSTAIECSPTANTFVTVTYENGNFHYSICLPTGEGTARIHNGTLEDLLDSSKTDMIKQATE